MPIVSFYVKWNLLSVLALHMWKICNVTNPLHQSRTIIEHHLQTQTFSTIIVSYGSYVDSWWFENIVKWNEWHCGSLLPLLEVYQMLIMWRMLDVNDWDSLPFFSTSKPIASSFSTLNQWKWQTRCYKALPRPISSLFLHPRSNPSYTIMSTGPYCRTRHMIYL